MYKLKNKVTAVFHFLNKKSYKKTIRKFSIYLLFVG
jgi:hypothetical protein